MRILRVIIDFISRNTKHMYTKLFTKKTSLKIYIYCCQMIVN